jgi:hypothetical protein
MTTILIGPHSSGLMFCMSIATVAGPFLSKEKKSLSSTTIERKKLHPRNIMLVNSSNIKTKRRDLMHMGTSAPFNFKISKF